MPKGRKELKTIEISERLQECLRPISQCALTTVTAPMGYGKTTAVNWYLSRQLKAEQAVQVRISIYSDNLPIFWKSVQVAFKRAGFGFLEDYACPEDVAGAGLLIEDMCHELSKTGSCYIFIDDFHLLTDSRASAFLCMVARTVGKCPFDCCREKSISFVGRYFVSGRQSLPDWCRTTATES